MKKEVKLVDIKAQYEEIKDCLAGEWEKIFDSMHLMLGPHMRAFEEEFAAYTGTSWGIGVDSGTAALFLAQKALDIGKRDEVITVSHTFFATLEAVMQNRALPVLLDIDETTLTMSTEKLQGFIEEQCRFDGERLIDKKTGNRVKAILPVHIYGLPADMEEIMAVARKYGLLVLEDCAQAHGAAYRERRVGSFGDAAAYSFYFSKNLSALGEGGIILTGRKEVKERCEMLRLHGQSDKYTHERVGYNSRLDEVQAAVLRLKLKRLDEWNRRRIELAEYYTRQLQDLPISCPHTPEDRVHVFHLYVIRSDRRDQLFEYLKEKGIGVGIHYPIPSHLQPAARDLGYPEGSLPVTERVSSEVLSLPMHPHLTHEEIDYVVSAIKGFF